MPIIVTPYRYVTSGGGPPPTPTVPSASFLGVSENGNNAASYTFSNFDIGTEHAQRIIAVGIIIRDPDDTNQITTVTLGGTAATKAIDTSTAAAVGNHRVAGIYYRAIATGLTTSAVVTLANAGTACALARWVIYPTSSTPVDAVGQSSGTGSSATATDLAVTAGGFVVAVHSHNNNTATTWAWTGVETVTVDEEGQLLSSGARWSAASFLATASSTSADLTASWPNGANNCIAAASWGP